MLNYLQTNRQITTTNQLTNQLKHI